MVAVRKENLQPAEFGASAEPAAASGARPRPASEGDSPVAAAVHAQQASLLEAFGSPEDAEAGYPGVVRLAILVGAPAGLWVLIFWGARAALHVFTR